MKIFVAGSSSAIALVRKVMDILRGVGYRLTHDWTVHWDERADLLPDVPWTPRGVALDDLRGVREADLLVLVITEHESEGRSVELGAALALGKPVLMLLTDHHPGQVPSQHRVYRYHPGVTWAWTPEHLLLQAQAINAALASSGA